MGVEYILTHLAFLYIDESWIKMKNVHRRQEPPSG